MIFDNDTIPVYMRGLTSPPPLKQCWSKGLLTREVFATKMTYIALVNHV